MANGLLEKKTVAPTQAPTAPLPLPPAITPTPAGLSQTKTTSGKKIFKCLLAGAIVILLVCIAAAYGWWRFGGRSATVSTPLNPVFPTTLTELNKWYQEPPDDQNAALFYKKISDSYRITDDDRAHALAVAKFSKIDNTLAAPADDGGLGSPSAPFLPPAQLPSLYQPLPEDMIPALRGLLLDFQPALGSISQGDDFTRSRYPIDLTVGAQTPLPHLKKLLELNRLLVLLSVYESDARPEQASLHWLLASFNVARSLDVEPLAESQATRAACVANSVAGLEQLFNRASFSITALGHLQENLDAAAQHEADGDSFTRAYAGQRLVALNLFDKPARELMSGISTIVPKPAQPKLAFAWLPLVIRNNIKAQRAFCEQTFNESIKIRQQPFPGRLSADNYAHSRGIEAQTNQFWLSGALGPGQMTVKEARTLALLRLAETATALESYRWGDGRYPGTLRELTPDFLKEAPPDPFTGKRFRYTRIRSGYELSAEGDGANSGPLTFKVIAAPRRRS